MYSENDLKKLADEYKEVKASEEVIKMLKETLNNTNTDVNNNKKTTGYWKSFISLAAGLIIFVIVINSAPSFAAIVNRIPILGTAAQVLIFREYEDEGENYMYSIDRAKLEGFNSYSLPLSLNEKYTAQSKELYGEFKAKLDGGVENIVLMSDYSIKANNGITMSIEHSIYESMASGYQRYEYDTIDIENEIYITLPSLFKDASYIDIIKEEVRNQMEAEMSRYEDVIYYTDDETLSIIDENQQFYINDDNKLVIVFNQFEVAPKYMGTGHRKGDLEFIIKTEAIENILVGKDYIK